VFSPTRKGERELSCREMVSSGKNFNKWKYASAELLISG